MAEQRDVPPSPAKELEISRSLLAILYWHDDERDHRRENRRAAIFIGTLLAASFLYFHPNLTFPPHGLGNWVSLLATMGRIAIIAWLIARGALSSR
jgi:hypothetical protein